MFASPTARTLGTNRAVATCDLMRPHRQLSSEGVSQFDSVGVKAVVHTTPNLQTAAGTPFKVF